jgi:hypothetical protein
MILCFDLSLTIVNQDILGAMVVRVNYENIGNLHGDIILILS